MNRLCVSLLALIVSLSACKKNKDEEKLPVFGNCDAITPTGGFMPGGCRLVPFIFRTSGGGTMLINPDLQIILKHDDYPGFKLEFWGSVDIAGGVKTAANHEKPQRKTY